MNSSGKNEASPSSELEENLEILRQTYFFSGLPLETLKVLLIFAPEKNLKGMSISLNSMKRMEGRFTSSAEKPNWNARITTAPKKLETALRVNLSAA